MMCAWLFAVFATTVAHARGVYQTPEAFLDEVFQDAPPRPQVVWLRGDIRNAADEIMGHRYPGLRIRYWRKDNRTAWILEEIGKERPITTGVVINENTIELVRVLEFRESRGGEVRHPFFTDQFKGTSLTDDNKIDRHIDGISGATLSVRALKKLARLALYLHSKTILSDDHTSQ
ncbi:MAG: FMN-binding protein [Gammaproteobacteria bacterium]|nr:FMN-binding protein [Gammaproteobacteria bacterium]